MASCDKAMESLSSDRVSYWASLTEDFSFREGLPQTEIPKENWRSCCGDWGPKPLLYPKVIIPKNYEPIRWKRHRAIEVAKRYIGLPYSHKHIPDAGGLDCSNFTSWVYNFGFGIGINSNVERQSETAGRKLEIGEAFQKGDLLFIWSLDGSRISHVVLYINKNQIIDSTGDQIGIRPFAGWYKERLAWGRRIFESGTSF